MPPIFWVQRQDIGPSPRVNHAMAYDSTHGRIVVFGGDPGGPPLGDTWEWDGSLWTQVADIGPAARRDHSLTEHRQAERLVLFGGASGALFLGDTWSFDGTEWIQVADTGPAARAGHAAAYDRTRQRLVLFGGENGSPLGDTWEWDGTDWTQVEDTGPSARRAHAMAFDPGRGRVILFGGADAAGSGLDDTWAWDGSNWTQIADTGPEPRAEAAMAGSASVLLFGGVNTIDPSAPSSNRILFGDTWHLTAEGWANVQDIGPSPRFGHAAASRAVQGSPSRVVVFGGGALFEVAEAPALAAGAHNDTWEVPEPAAAGGQPQPLQITSATVQPPTVAVFPPSSSVTLTITTSAPPPAGTIAAITIVRLVGGVPQPAVPDGFLNPPTVAFNGLQTTLVATIVRDTSFPQPGSYGFSVTIGSSTRIAPFQFV